MKSLNYALVSSLCALVIGILLVTWPDVAVSYLVITIGVLFLIPGLVGLFSYLALLNKSKADAPRPVFPIVALGSTLFGVWLIIMPSFFVGVLMYVLGILLVLGGISQLANLIAARSFMPVPFGVYIVPVLILAAGITVLFNPFATAEIPFIVLGISSIVYALMDMVRLLRFRLFQTSAPFPGCAFLLCLRGSCRVKIHLTCYDLKEGSLAIIFPGVFFQIQEQSKDCRFIFVGFSKKLIEGAKLFSYTVEYTPYIFERPVIEMKKDVYELFRDSIRLLIRRQKIKEEMSGMQISLIYTQLLLSLGSVYKKRGEEEDSPRYNRNQEIVKELVRIIVQYYKTERNVSFYAEKLHLSPQHLSTTVKKVTGKTLTDILSSFIIRDAQAKLRSTDMTVQEIAYSLNFSDISFFGKYFKRYTGMSPKQYRNM